VEEGHRKVTKLTATAALSDGFVEPEGVAEGVVDGPNLLRPQNAYPFIEIILTDRGERV